MLFCFIFSFFEAKRKGGIKIHKPKPIKLKPIKPLKLKPIKPLKLKPIKPLKLKPIKPLKLKPLKIHHLKPIKMQIHHKGIHHAAAHHRKHFSGKVIQATEPVPLYSPPFNGTDTGQIPLDSQVVLIADWLSKVGATIDVFLRLQSTFPDGSLEQRRMIKNVYPPLRILLEAQHLDDFKNNNPQ